MNLAFDTRNLEGAAQEVMNIVSTRGGGNATRGRDGIHVDFSNHSSVKDFLIFQAEKMAAACLGKGVRPDFYFPPIIGTAYFSINLSMEPIGSRMGSPGALTYNGDSADTEYLVIFHKYIH